MPLKSILILFSILCLFFFAANTQNLKNNDLHLGKDTAICSNDSFLLTVPDYYTQYNWNTGDTMHYIWVTCSGNYFVIVTDSLGTVDTSTIKHVLEKPVPNPIISPNTYTHICKNDSIEISLVSNHHHLLWSTGATTNSIFANNTNWYWLRVQNEEGCYGYDSVYILVENPKPEIHANPDSIEKGKCTELSVPSFNTYYWYPDISLSIQSEQYTTACPDSSIIYYIEVTDNEGCTGIDSIYIKIYEIYDINNIPNTITPNGDGVNDTFIIENIKYYKGNTIAIYNRWGEKIYETTNYNNTWDGNDLPAGAYFYILKIPQGKKTYTGNINIIR